MGLRMTFCRRNRHSTLLMCALSDSGHLILTDTSAFGSNEAWAVPLYPDLAHVSECGRCFNCEGVPLPCGLGIQLMHGAAVFLRAWYPGDPLVAFPFLGRALGSAAAAARYRLVESSHDRSCEIFGVGLCALEGVL